jgi:hypothetical protein
MSDAFNLLNETHVKLIAEHHAIEDYENKSREELLAIINKDFSGLELEQFKVLAKHYNFDNYENKTLEELRNSVIVQEFLNLYNIDISNVSFPKINITRDLSNNYHLDFIKESLLR